MAGRSGKHLVIVESPAKAKTINKYLGDGYVVKASMGHVRDLPSKGMGVDLTTFEPDYQVLPTRSKVITELKKLAREATDIYLATDLDREGEAIAWHLKEALGLKDDRVKRVIFNAITRAEIQRAFSQPHSIDIDRVNAQQARRILDRIVGYEISPILWRKVARGLSAGRVQSVAVRLVVEREREIEAFVAEEFWTIGAVFTTTSAGLAALAGEWAQFNRPDDQGAVPTKPQRERWMSERGCFAAELVEFAGRKFESIGADDARRAAEALGFVVRSVVSDEPDDSSIALVDAKAAETARAPAAIRLIGALERATPFSVRSIERKRSTSRPPAPFITSTLQQGASTRLAMGAQRAMRLAQTLYEAGHITYMRTDSTHLTREAIGMARDFVGRQFGDAYLPASANVFQSSNKAAQEAHEAIRPTDVALSPERARRELEPDQARLYELIWRRFVACQMAPAAFDQTVALIHAATPSGDAVFKATGRKLVFDGFMKVAGVSSDDQLLPELREGAAVHAVDLQPTQHFTQPPPRFSEASLVKALEQLGIGRPSTYASITQTIQDRQYVTQINRRFHATLLGMVVTDKLMQAFPDIMNVSFTADMELKLDKIEEQHLDWIKLLRDFYGPFKNDVASALEKLEHAGGTPSPYPCAKCGARMLYRISKNGFFLACERRECDHTQPVDVHGKPALREVSPYRCPKCGREMMKRRGRFGEFLSCTGYAERDAEDKPACSMIISLDRRGQPEPPKVRIETPVKCEKCREQRPMILRDSKRGPFLGCSGYPKCRATKFYGKLSDEEKALIDPLLPELKRQAEQNRRLVEQLKAQVAQGAHDAPPETPADAEQGDAAAETLEAEVA